MLEQLEQEFMDKEEKVKVTFPNLDGSQTDKWISYKEWVADKNFRHKKEMYFLRFGCRAAGLTDIPITKEENEMFDKWYKEKFPDRCKLKPE